MLVLVFHGRGREWEGRLSTAGVVCAVTGTATGALTIRVAGALSRDGTGFGHSTDLEPRLRDA